MVDSNKTICPLSQPSRITSQAHFPSPASSRCASGNALLQ
jgi:hypothetical protein